MRTTQLGHSSVTSGVRVCGAHPRRTTLDASTEPRPIDGFQQPAVHRDRQEPRAPQIRHTQFDPTVHAYEVATGALPQTVTE